MSDDVEDVLDRLPEDRDLLPDEALDDGEVVERRERDL